MANVVRSLQTRQAVPSAPCPLLSGVTQVDTEAKSVLPIPGKNDYSEAARQDRLAYIQKQSGAVAPHIGSARLDATLMRGTVENYIGAIQVPVGLAGPLLFDGASVQGFITAPFATIEGALVASVCRGSRLLTAAGGVYTQVISQSVHRAPSFNVDNLRDAIRLKEFVENHLSTMQAFVRQASKHAVLQEVVPFVNGRTLHVVMHFSTGDAAGQNMVTVVADHLSRELVKLAEANLGIAIRSFQIEGGMNGDKKVNFYSFIKGRGVRVAAECFIPNHVFIEQFRLDPDAFYEHYQRGVAASSLIGGMGVNVNVANALAALFIATGQDAASVHESSVGYLLVERGEDGLYCCLTLPSLLVGTVGGGTILPTQSEGLALLDCMGAGKKGRLAEIIAGFCLALDLSTWSAIAAHTFTDAHKRLGRR
jgi:hydroxymethylglutaryl-CoA reductase (NADPH)